MADNELAQKYLAGDTGSQYFDKHNGLIDAVVASLAARDAAISASAGQVTALQTLISQLVAGLYIAPAGGYKAPILGAAQMYSGNAQPWTTVTPLNRITVTTVPQSATFTNHKGGRWNATSIYTLSYETYNSSTYCVFRRMVVNSAGVVTATQTVSVGIAGSNLNIGSSVVISDTQVMLFSAGGQTYLVTYDGNVTLSVISVSRGTNPFASLYSAPHRRLAYLMGSVSTLFYGVSNTYYASGTLCDRAASQTANFSGNPVYQAPVVNGDFDNIGGGYTIRLTATATPFDPVYRPTVILEYWDDQGCTVLQKLRIPNRTIGTLYSCIVMSPTLAIVSWGDTSGTLYTAAISINTATGALGLYGPYTTLNFAQFPPKYPMLFDPLNSYNFRTTSLTGAAKLSKVTFNPNAASGLELVSDPANDISFTLGGAVAATSQAAVAGVTTLTVIDAFMLGPNTLGVMYYVAATTNAVYLDIFNLI